jgi:signal transduction histidine kinase
MLAETLRLRNLDGAERSEYLDLIMTESERLGRLLNNVLDFARLEKGVKTYQMDRVGLEPIIAAAVRCIQQPLREKHIQLQVSGAGDNVILHADRDALEQALLNLLHNAVKYSHNGGLVEVLTARHHLEVLIQVRDHGVGIHLRDHHRIFERFYRAPEEHNRRIPGTGLGLALVKHIIEAHGGRVSVESVPGQGSTFSLRLPLAVDQD